ncbi:phospholipase D-like domain-containing protein [Viridibacterium curvum]|uniref:PLD phosphodiesterase domain-containing protein n=1 Tax=Viridibacterium curvum TaxID=1101404 RepID=A0ABP9QJ44_9RHOO
MNANLPAQARLALLDDTLCTATGQYFCNERQFALPVSGNKVEIMESGQKALAEVAQAMRKAEKLIFIADWQMAFDVEIEKRGEEGNPGRLWRVFEDIIKTKAVQIRVLLYRSVADSKPGTYDGRVARALNAINKKEYPGKLIVMLQGPTSAQNDSWDYSHHQKFVVVDGRVAFVGGIDLTYGRYETPEYDVVVDPSRFVLNEMYNPCATRVRGMTPDEKALLEQGFAEPYSTTLLEEGCQPRMPWQDVHMKMEGPAAFDVLRNFARRWNMLAKWSARPANLSRESAAQIAMIDDKWLAHHQATGVPSKALADAGGQATVQIVRSVSSAHLRGESYDQNGRFTPPADLAYLKTPSQRPVLESCLKDWQSAHQDNIQNAMLNCIASAENYVYIETQFFISDFGKAGPLKEMRTRAGTFHYYPVDSSKIGNENDGIKNHILDALARRIDEHIQAGTNFHVYLVVPVHPEGAISDGSVWKQHWLALASIHHGSNSLIGRIKRSLSKEGRKPEEWCKYLTVLNMRNYGIAVQYARDPKNYREDFAQEIGRYLITEQIYIHSKLLIVDDAVAIIGSANINDRSLTGNGDTEIAAVVVDNAGIETRDLGNPQYPAITRKFARELRRSLWTKHFGFAINGNNYFRSTARAEKNGHPPKAPLPHPPRETTSESNPVFGRLLGKARWSDVLDKPCSPDTVTAIQAIASHNQKIYGSVFTHLPRDGMKQFTDILDKFSCPYPVAVDAEARIYVREAEWQYEQGVSGLKGNPYLTPEQRVTQQAVLAQKRDAAIATVPKNLSKSSLGVVPPALQPAFMTTQLRDHQRAALQVPMQNYKARYVTYAGNAVHDLEKAQKHLSDNLIGFFVQAPLQWGEGVEVDGSVDHHMSVDIASVDVKLPPSVS